MLQRTALLCALVMTTYCQSPFGTFGGGGPPPSFSSGGPPSSFGGGGPPPSYSSGGPSSFSSGGPPSFSSGGPPSFSSGGPPSFSSGGPPSFSSGGPPLSSPFGPGGRPSFNSGGPPPFSSNGPFGGSGPSGRPGKGPKKSSGSGLFNWIGSTMSKLQGLGPKITYHSTKPKPSQLGGPPPQNSPFYSSGGPPSEISGFPSKPSGSFFDGPSPYSSQISYASPNSIDHPPVVYRNQGGPPPSSFGPRPGPPPPSYTSSRPPSFGSRRPPSYSPDGPFSTSSFSSGPPSSGGFSPSSFSSSQGERNHLDVFPSQQISYQSETLTSNSPSFGTGFGSLQSLYSSQGSKPSYNQGGSYEQQSSFSQIRPQQAKGGNYGATFQNVEPVSVAPIYDINRQSSDFSGATSVIQHQSSNIHDTPFATLVNDYAAHADAVTAGSEQHLTQGSSDMATAASSSAFPGQMHVLGQSTNSAGNPVFEVVADANAPTYNGHPVDLSKLISMIEPGAQIDTMNAYGDTDTGASEQQPMYSGVPSNLDSQSDASMMSGIVSGNKNTASPSSHTFIKHFKSSSSSDQLHASSESMVTVLKPDGTKLSDDKLIKEHFDKDVILNDDLQDSKGEHGFIIMTNRDDNDKTNTDGKGSSEHDSTTDTNNNDKTHSLKQDNDDELLSVVQQLRNSASSEIVSRYLNDSKSFVVAIPKSNNITIEEHLKTMHPNHNYHAQLLTKLGDNNDTFDKPDVVYPPVINTFLDNVQPNSFDFSSDRPVNGSNKSDLSKMFEDYDSDEMVPGDMFVDSEGDLDAAGSRNVKSVAIIVTPPPNYVKIKSKVQKTGVPLSAMATSTMPPEVVSSVSEVSVHTGKNQRFSNQTVSLDSRNKSSLSSSAPSSDLDLDGHPVSNLSNTSGEGQSLIQFNSTTSSENTKSTRRHPVYRGKNGSS